MIPVSICLTTYNRAAVLARTLDSILAQTFGDFELIINDDRSTDGTEEICRDYEKKDKRIKYFCNPANLRMPGNLNAAIRRATGLYVANLHDGDVYRSDLIAKWKEALDQTPDAPFVFNGYETLHPDGSRRLFKEPFDAKVPGVYIAKGYFQCLASCVWGTVMVRASAYEKFGLFDPAFGFISDVDMWLRLAKGRSVAYIPEPLITVTEREPDHPFASYSWDHLFWQFGIYNRHIDDYSRLYPDQISRSSSDYLSMRRKLFFTAMLSLIKKQKWSRMREGFAIWRDARDPFLKVPGMMFGRAASRPSWYDSSWWNIAENSQRS